VAQLNAPAQANTQEKGTMAAKGGAIIVINFNFNSKLVQSKE
jgi:hypothetical protein